VLLRKLPKIRQKEKVRRDLNALARRGDLTLEAFEKLIPGYDAYAKRYAKRLLAYFRVGRFSAYDVAKGRWSEIEAIGQTAWYNSEGQLIPRALSEMEKEEKAAARALPKRDRPLCDAICQNGNLCQARARPGQRFCLKHSQKF
jgi:hypothetical protein